MERNEKLEMEWLNLKTLEKDLLQQSEFLGLEIKRQMFKDINLAKLLIKQKNAMDLELLKIQDEVLLLQEKLQTVSLEQLNKKLNKRLEDLKEKLNDNYKCLELLQEECDGIKNEVREVNESGKNQLKGYYSWAQEKNQREIASLTKNIFTLSWIESMGTWPLDIKPVSRNKKH